MKIRQGKELRPKIMEFNEDEAIKIMLQVGISRDHIESQKLSVFQELPIRKYYDRLEDSTWSSKKVPVDKISAIALWDTAGKSVYDLFMGKLDNDIHRSRIMENLDSLKVNGLDYQYSFYAGDTQLKGDDVVEFSYYRKEDYYIAEDGTHRIISAKMFNAPFMSGKVTIYELNQEKKDLLEEYCNLKNMLFSNDFDGLLLEKIARIPEAYQSEYVQKVSLPNHDNYLAKVKFENPEKYEVDTIKDLQKTNMKLRGLVNKRNEYLSFIADFSYDEFLKKLSREKFFKLFKSNNKTASNIVGGRPSVYTVNLITLPDLDDEQRLKITLSIGNCMQYDLTH